MPKRVGKYERGFVDPLSLLGLLFLVVSLGVMTYVTANPNIRQLIGSSAKVAVEDLVTTTKKVTNTVTPNKSKDDKIECEPSCATNACGANSDGCGGSCTCPYPLTCNDGKTCSYISTEAKDAALTQKTTAVTKETIQEPITTTTSTTGLTCDADGVAYKEGAKVIGGSGGGTSGYSKCVGGRWTDCPECSLTTLTTVPYYLKDKYSEAIQAQTQSQQTTPTQTTSTAPTTNTVSIGGLSQEIKLARADCAALGGQYSSATGYCLKYSTSQTVEKQQSGATITNSTTILRDLNTGKIIDAKTTSSTPIAPQFQPAIPISALTTTTAIFAKPLDATCNFNTDCTSNSCGKKSIVSAGSVCLPNEQVASVPTSTSTCQPGTVKTCLGTFCSCLTPDQKTNLDNSTIATNNPLSPQFAATIPKEYDFNIKHLNNYGFCNGSEFCNNVLTSFETGLDKGTVGKFTNYTEAFAPDKVKLVWEEAGYSSLKKCQDDMIAKYHNPQAPASCNTYQPTKEQVITSVDLGVTLTEEGAALAALPATLTTGSLGGAAVTAFKAFTGVSTLSQTGNAVSAQIEDPLSTDANVQTGRALLSWANLGTAQYVMTAATNLSRFANTAVSIANIFVDLPTAIDECWREDASLNPLSGCGGSLAALASDFIFLGVDTWQGQTSFREPSFQVSPTEADAALARIFTNESLNTPKIDVADPFGSKIAVPEDFAKYTDNQLTNVASQADLESNLAAEFGNYAKANVPKSAEQIAAEAVFVNDAQIVARPAVAPPEPNVPEIPKVVEPDLNTANNIAEPQNIVVSPPIPTKSLATRFTEGFDNIFVKPLDRLFFSKKPIVLENLDNVIISERDLQIANSEIIGPSKVPVQTGDAQIGQIRADQAEVLSKTGLPHPSLITQNPDLYVERLQAIARENGLDPLTIPINPSTQDIKNAAAEVVVKLTDRYDALIVEDVLAYRVGLATEDLNALPANTVPRATAEQDIVIQRSTDITPTDAEIEAVRIKNASLEDDIRLALYTKLIDPATDLKLLNKLGGEQRLNDVLRDIPTGTPVTVVDLGLSDLKKVNDTFGHDVGDRLLIESARIIDSTVANSGIPGAKVVHINGKEYRLILPNADETTAKRILDQITTNINIETARLQNLNSPDARIFQNMGFDYGIAKWDGVESTSEFAKRAADTRIASESVRKAQELELALANPPRAPSLYQRFVNWIKGTDTTAVISAEKEILGPSKIPTGSNLPNKINADQASLLKDTGMPHPDGMANPAKYIDDLNKVIEEKGLTKIEIPINPTHQDLEIAGAKVERMIIEKYESFTPIDMIEYKSTLAVTDLKNFPLNTVPHLDPVVNNAVFRSAGEEFQFQQQRTLNLEAALKDAKYKDPMTGLYNKAGGDLGMAVIIDAARATNGKVAIINIDVSGLGAINNNPLFGREAGDQLLIMAADIFDNTPRRSSDIVFRIGDGPDAVKVIHSHGDEFAIILPGVDEVGAKKIFDRLYEELAARKAADPENSILQILNFDAGIAHWNGTETIEQFVKRSDEAMYVNKVARKAAQEAANNPPTLFENIFNRVKTFFASPASEQAGGVSVDIGTAASKTANTIETVQPGLLPKVQDWYSANIQDEKGLLPSFRKFLNPEAVPVSEVPVEIVAPISQEVTVQENVNALLKKGANGVDPLAPNAKYNTPDYNDVVDIPTSRISAINSGSFSAAGDAEHLSIEQIRELIRNGEWKPGNYEYSQDPISGYELPDGTVYIETGRHRVVAQILEGQTEIPIRVYTIENRTELGINHPTSILTTEKPAEVTTTTQTTVNTQTPPQPKTLPWANENVNTAVDNTIIFAKGATPTSRIPAPEFLVTSVVVGGAVFSFDYIFENAFGVDLINNQTLSNLWNGLFGIPAPENAVTIPSESSSQTTVGPNVNADVQNNNQQNTVLASSIDTNLGKTTVFTSPNERLASLLSSNDPNLESIKIVYFLANASRNYNSTNNSTDGVAYRIYIENQIKNSKYAYLLDSPEFQVALRRVEQGYGGIDPAQPIQCEFWGMMMQGIPGMEYAANIDYKEFNPDVEAIFGIINKFLKENPATRNAATIEDVFKYNLPVAYPAGQNTAYHFTSVDGVRAGDEYFIKGKNHTGRVLQIINSATGKLYVLTESNRNGDGQPNIFIVTESEFEALVPLQTSIFLRDNHAIQNNLVPEIVNVSAPPHN
ncbi:MAG TPA: diguanylate cyclase [Patescibacteria group bacterium]|nr:diguanylate cyclase [Patescibacteria group bacterium]